VPLGVVCAITPFNAPLNTVAHKVDRRSPPVCRGAEPSLHTPMTSCIMASVWPMPDCLQA